MADNKPAGNPRKLFGAQGTAPAPAPTSKPTPENTEPAGSTAERREQQNVKVEGEVTLTPADQAKVQPTRGTDPKKATVAPSRTPPANAANLNPPAATPQVREQARDSEDRRTQQQAQDTGGLGVEKPVKEGEYRDPNVPPNPDVEAYPNQKPNEKRKFGFRPREGNVHQVYPEAFLGTTPTDPDLREADDKTSEEQTKEMVDRRSLRTDGTVDLKMKNERFDRRMKEFRDNRAEGSPEPPPKFEGGQTKLKANESYVIRTGQLGSNWWLKKYNTEYPTIVIEGTVEDVLGAPFGDRRITGHYLVQEFNDRRNAHPKGHPIRRDDKVIYVGRVMGRRVLVHPFEVETAESSQKENEKPATPA
jgi:hypothetical protein